MDDALAIVSGAIDNHVKMINEYKGVPGVQPARLQEGYQVVIRANATCNEKLTSFVHLVHQHPSCS